ncbi:hypothetical protein BCON_0178g00090 [Botryotinia convoluta]|uniref:Heterokaryon incompatibility domain-containing protein n=1 Tax=Botryotinia convoluta TaxID=54673 RepID=A0A4Z1I132_9HELO|nr:hypothetical protein BCON_0178g00090 [Botryotinia convoluta]
MLRKVCKSLNFGDSCYRQLQFTSNPLTVGPKAQHHDSDENLLGSARKGYSPAATLNIIDGRPIPITPFSSESFETAREWLWDCYRNHKHSCSIKRAALLPFRVIDVGSGNDLGIPHLHISKEGEMGNWAALSHCWEKTRSHVTNVTNLDRRMHSISLEELPSTLRDAIKVTRCMGLQYLWIDSIYILQGSDVFAQADWLSESRRMRECYKCCDFCIAADDASSDEVGFLRIWAEDAHAGLFWRTPIPVVNPPTEYVAPSWSWVSLDISLYYYAYKSGYYPVGGWKLDDSRFKANISSCEIMTDDGIPNGRLSNARLTLRTLCLHSNRWEALEDMVIGGPYLLLPDSSLKRQLLLKLDAESPVNSLLTKWKARLARWKARLASLFQKPSRFRILPDFPRFLGRKEDVQRLSTVQRDSDYLTIVQIASFKDPAVEYLGRHLSHAGSAMCLLVQPGAEKGTFKRVDLAQISNFRYCDSLPWEMHTIVLV